MSIAEMYDLLPTIPPWMSILIVGETGIGKSTIVRHWAKNMLQMHMEEFNCSEAPELGDILGLPDIENGKTITRPPPWLRTDVPMLLFLDEINRAGAGAIVKGLMGFANDQRIGNFKLAEGSRIVCAINPDRANIYDVLKFDPAMMDRFFVIELDPTPEEWMLFAEENGVHPAIIKYIDGHKTDLDAFGDEDNVSAAKKASEYRNVLPTRRSWHKFSTPLNNLIARKTEKNMSDEYFSKLLYFLCAGFVGERVARKFCAFYTQMNGAITVSDILDAKSSDWDEYLTKKVEYLCKTQSISAKYLVSGLCRAVEKAEDKLWADSEHTKPSRIAEKYAANVYSFMNAITSEFVSMMYYKYIKPTKESGAMWAKILVNAEPGIADKLEAMVKNTTKG